VQIIKVIRYRNSVSGLPYAKLSVPTPLMKEIEGVTHMKVWAAKDGLHYEPVIREEQ
jgi:hypothetical protein